MQMIFPHIYIYIYVYIYISLSLSLFSLVRTSSFRVAPNTGELGVCKVCKGLWGLRVSILIVVQGLRCCGFEFVIRGLGLGSLGFRICVLGYRF